MRPLYPLSVYPRTLLATTIALALSSAAMAQEVAPDTANENDYIEEITVTAQMREQSVMDVPVTMDVIGSEFLERTNIMELDELSRILPNVQIQEQAVSLPSFNIRGVTDDVSSVSATPRISVYQDGFDISKKTVASVALFDIARVEVLKVFILIFPPSNKKARFRLAITQSKGKNLNSCITSLLTTTTVFV